MKLPAQDTAHFFRLMWALQFYVNGKLKIHDVQDLETYAGCSIGQKMTVRDALFENIDLIDAFALENPQQLSPQDLASVSGWKHFIKGGFFIERLLKKYAVFIQEETVYGVLALSQGFDELTQGQSLPLYVSTVLLPFQGVIVYDGILGFRHLSFGGGIQRGLKETYLRAKRQNRIIGSLEPSREEKRRKSKPKPVRNWKPELEELSRKASALKGSTGEPALFGPAFSLVKASVAFAHIAVSDPDDEEGLNRALRKVRRAFNKSHAVLYREDF